MKTCYDLAQLEWRLTGWTPYLWQFQPTLESSASPDAVVSVAAKVPGSVQAALRTAGVIPDWNVGLNARACEWVENRQWLFETVLPDAWFEKGKTFRLRCQGLDYNGWVYLNGHQVGSFCGTHIPHTFELTPYLAEQHNVLRIAFDLAPRWLGQFGYTSRMQEWKTRFNYTWDWQPRLVQIGIWDAIEIIATDGLEITTLSCTTGADFASGKGSLAAHGTLVAPGGASIKARLEQAGKTIHEEELSAAAFAAGTNCVVHSWATCAVSAGATRQTPTATQNTAPATKPTPIHTAAVCALRDRAHAIGGPASGGAARAPGRTVPSVSPPGVWPPSASPRNSWPPGVL